MSRSQQHQEAEPEPDDAELVVSQLHHASPGRWHRGHRLSSPGGHRTILSSCAGGAGGRVRGTDSRSPDAVPRTSVKGTGGRGRGGGRNGPRSRAQENNRHASKQSDPHGAERHADTDHRRTLPQSAHCTGDNSKPCQRRTKNRTEPHLSHGRNCTEANRPAVCPVWECTDGGVCWSITSTSRVSLQRRCGEGPATLAGVRAPTALASAPPRRA